MEHLALPGSLTVLISEGMKNANQGLSPIKTIMHGAQLISRKTLEHHQQTFGGISWVSVSRGLVVMVYH